MNVDAKILFIYFIFGHTGSLLLCVGFCYLWPVGFSLLWLLLSQSVGSRVGGLQ